MTVCSGGYVPTVTELFYLSTDCTGPAHIGVQYTDWIIKMPSGYGLVTGNTAQYSLMRSYQTSASSTAYGSCTSLSGGSGTDTLNEIVPYNVSGAPFATPIFLGIE